MEGVDYTNNSFDYTTSIGKTKLKFKLLTGKDEKLIEKDIEQSAKYGYDAGISTRLRYMITEVDGDKSQEVINSYTQNMLPEIQLHLENMFNDITPDIELTQEIEIGGDTVSASIPLTVEFFFGLAPSNKKEIHQSIFYFIYGAPGFTFDDVYNMPVPHEE